MKLGIENPKNHWKIKVFIVPIRNWNEVARKEKRNNANSFYSTYKELKREIIDYLNNYGLRFYSTYKELKLTNTGTGSPTGIGFYSTYKELKLLSNCANPLRDLRFYSTYKELKPIKIFYNVFTILIVFIVPIRNWNPDLWNTPATISPGFYSTYKELKLPCYILKSINFIVFIVPIRNWNEVNLKL